MPKIDVSKVAEVLKKNQADPKLLRQVIEDLNTLTQAEAREESVPSVKKQFVVLVSDPDGDLSDRDFAAWVLQIPENESVATTQDRINRAAYEYNASNQNPRPRAHHRQRNPARAQVTKP